MSKEEVERIFFELMPKSTGQAAAKELEAQGWRGWYAELFGQSFVDALAPHHIEAVEWHWESRRALLKNEKPEYFAYFPIWSRGHMKSSVAERLVVVDACLSSLYNQPGYTLYIAQNKDKIQENISNIEELFSNEKVRKYFPLLSQVARNDETNQKRQWQATFLRTAANYTVKGGSIESAQAGSRINETRPTFFVPDDIDGREDSPVIAEGRFKRLVTEILPMKQANTLTFFAQNLISRYSVMYRIYSGKARVLTNRKPTKPVPAVLNLVTEIQTVGGIVKDIYVSGTSTWHAWDKERIQEEIDSYGLESFKTECQHEVSQSKEGLILHNYDDAVHVISYSEFAAVYGSPDAWKDWFKAVFNDWSRTKTERHANVAGFVAVSSQNSALPAITFYIPLSFPANQMPEDVATRLLSALTPNAYGETSWRTLVNDAMRRANSEQHYTTTADILEYSRSYLKNSVLKYARQTLSAYNVMAGAMSHSEDTVRQIFNEVFGFPFVPSNPSRTDAIEDITRALSVDYTQAHLFRPGERGYTRAYILAPDDTTKTPEIVDGREIYPPRPYPDALQPDELHDSDLMRYQFCNWRWRTPVLTANGETVDDVLKINDDFGQGLQMVYFKKLLSNIPLSKTEKIELHLSPQIRENVLAEMEQSPEKDALFNRRRLELAQLDKQFKKPVRGSSLNRFSRR